MPREEADRKCCACTVEWAMWGNMNAFYAGLFIFVGSVVAASIPEIAIDGQFPTNVGSALRWINIFIGLFVMLVEYPLSARRSKKTAVERPGQRYIAPILHNLRFVGSNYIIRFMLYMIISVPVFFVLSSIFGGLCLLCACACYFAAALNGESWKAPTLGWGPGKTVTKKGPQIKEIPKAPTEPPPRPPPQAREGLMAPPSGSPPGYP
ncbi:PREDICTED: cytochrome b-245 light chain-like [Amphimedon queenslandica]|uniref:Cytochrome b-245 light chain n=1 Tax=Amphimedon queenslandica TaxID=400682 RepID=A0A1X7ULS7_AMPQE|nr:PREDICTED: cytochrome b-245 light chain-like [Amphimedon queenslandica]|eukprot:XP_003387341.1 PREDICTED: cytochrome b-245 light chain-like [Amphimedon queenslandica]